ncbi:MAG: TapB family protein [Candidatus Cyclobacteriaceae bacterium M2_1C_046]
MKKLCLFIFCWVITYASFGQCNPYYDIKENASWTMQLYDAKGKPDGKQINKITELNSTENGWIASVNSTLYDKKDKEIQEVKFEMECSNGIIEVELSKYIPQETLQAFQDMDMEFKGENLMLPKDLSVGKNLDDGSMTISGNMPFEITIAIQDRKVESKETVTVPAGTFEVFKITYTTRVKSMVSVETKGVEYVAEDIGVVKTESYNKNGKLIGTSELITYSID